MIRIKKILFVILILTAIFSLFLTCCKTKIEKPPYLQLSEEEVKEGITRCNIEDLCLTVDEISDKCCEEYPGNIEVAGIATEQKLSPTETQILHFINFNRSKHGLSALFPNDHLSSIARIRSTDMLNRNYFSHSTPEGKNIFDILRENGVIYINAGENLAHASPPSWGSPEAIIIAWINSPTHKANIIRDKYGKIGISVVDSSSRRVVTTVFMN